MREKQYLIAGIDDATKCPCIGSIFIAGVLANHEIIKYWRSIGVKDSKVIMPDKREKLAKEIKTTAIFYSIKEITPAHLKDDKLNLNDLEMVKAFEILNELNKKNNAGKVFIDNWEVTLDRFKIRLKDIINKKLAKQFKDVKILPSHKADEKYTIVGAASILAKTGSDKQYREYKKVYGDFGSGSPADPKTRLFVWEHRKSPPPIIRTTWVTYNTISKLKDIQDDKIFKKLKIKN